MAASLLLLLLLPLAPALASPAQYAMMEHKEARSDIKESAKVYMEHKVQMQQGIANRAGQRKDGQLSSSGPRRRNSQW
jgi:hypothetical protein